MEQEDANSKQLDALRMRDELLQALFWMTSQGLGPELSLGDVARFVATPALELSAFMRELVQLGLLDAAEDGSYTLTRRGEEDSRRRFADLLEDLLCSQGHHLPGSELDPTDAGCAECDGTRSREWADAGDAGDAGKEES